MRPLLQHSLCAACTLCTLCSAPRPVQVRASSTIYRGFAEAMVGLGAHAQELSSLYTHCDHLIGAAMDAQRASGACWPAAPPKLQAVLAERRAEQRRLEAACASLQAALPNARFEGHSFPVPMYERLCLHVSRILQTSLQLLDVLEDGTPRATDWWGLPDDGAGLRLAGETW